MIAYIYDKPNLQIHTKIENVLFVDDNDGKIVGDNMTPIFGLGSEYIILQQDNINLNVGDIIDTSNLENTRNYFLLGKEKWFKEQMQKQDKKMQRLLQLLEVKEQ